MKVAIVVFPGSNCDADALYALRDVLHADAAYVWHKQTSLPVDTRLVVLPGGFSYGDYLRSGAIARFSPIMPAVAAFARDGGHVLGICNGFQILTEAGLLPGVLNKNTGLKFVCQQVRLRVENASTPFTSRAQVGDVLKMPVAHHDGCYYAPASVLDDLEAHGDVLLRYVDENGKATDAANPNGSLRSIAGIRNRAGNVYGLMPHPERACEPALSSADGLMLLGSICDALGGGAA